MSDLEKALELDIAEKTVAAADAYESVLMDADAPLDAYLNLANIYWFVLESLPCTAYHFDRDFVHRSEKRMNEVLRAAEKKFPDMPEIRFWELFFAYIFGTDPFHEECLELIQQPNCSLVPFFYLRCFGYKPALEDQAQAEELALEYQAQVEELYKKIKNELTHKNRYIISVLDSTWGRHRPPDIE